MARAVFAVALLALLGRITTVQAIIPLVGEFSHAHAAALLCVAAAAAEQQDAWGLQGLQGLNVTGAAEQSLLDCPA